MTEKLAKKLRKHVIEMTHRGKSSHVGSCLSIADLMAVLYGDVLRYDAKNPADKNRDRFILSKGHAGACVYAALAESGFFDIDLLKEHYKNGSILSGHVSHKGVAGVELSTGSLGQGLSVATGMALSAKLNKEKHRVFIIMGDGECDEGSIWEAAMFASHHRLNNLTALIDYNCIQSLASVEETMALEPFADKWESFGWNVQEIDGHDHDQIKKALLKKSDKPKCIVAHTTKGKGVSFMENSVLWHYRTPQGDEYVRAMAELS